MTTSSKSSTNGVRLIKPQSPLRVTSIAASFKLGCTVDFNVLKHQLVNFEYNPNKHNAMVIRRRNPNVTIMLFSTGSCIVTGATTEKDVKISARRFLRQLQRLGYRVCYTGVQINSVSGAFDVGCGLDLNKLANLNHHYSYNPESFAGGILRYDDNKTLMVFHTGCVTITGAKSIKEMQDDYPYVLYLLHSAKKQ